jgi:hypothetical protein
MKMENPFFWTLLFSYTPLYWRVRNLVRKYDKLLGETMTQLARDEPTPNVHIYDGRYDPEGLALLAEIEKINTPTSQETDTMVSAVTMYLVNSKDIREFVSDYWYLRTDILRCKIYGLKMLGTAHPGADNIVIQHEIDGLQNNLNMSEKQWSLSCAIPPRFEKKEFPYLGSSQSEESDGELGGSSDSDSESDSPVLKTKTAGPSPSAQKTPEAVHKHRAGKADEKAPPKKITDSPLVKGALAATQARIAKIAKMRARSRSPKHT